MKGKMPLKALVYVVDDDAALGRGIARLLRAAGLESRVFDSARAYLDAAPEPCEADCLLLDLRMPEISGTELQALVSGTAHDVPIVFLTGHGDIPTCVRALKAGAVGFLAKPFDAEELLAAVAEALQRSVQLRESRARAEEDERLFQRLSRREREVFEAVAQGGLNKLIAEKLGISEKTVKIHRARVMAKLEVGSLAALVRLAERRKRPAGGS